MLSRLRLISRPRTCAGVSADPMAGSQSSSTDLLWAVAGAAGAFAAGVGTMLAWQRLRPAAAGAGAPGAAQEPAANDSVYESDEEEEPGEGEEEMKMVFCVRTDLKMSKGKAAAQCCHAAIGAFRRAVRANKEQVKTWERLGAAKITLKVQSEEDMFRVAEAAHKKGIVTFVVVRGRACALLPPPLPRQADHAPPRRGPAPSTAAPAPFCPPCPGHRRTLDAPRFRPARARSLHWAPRPCRWWTR